MNSKCHIELDAQLYSSQSPSTFDHELINLPSNNQSFILSTI